MLSANSRVYVTFSFIFASSGADRLIKSYWNSDTNYNSPSFYNEQLTLSNKETYSIW